MSSPWQQKTTIIEKASAKLGLMFNTSKRERIMAQIKINDRMEAETETFSFQLCNTTDNSLKTFRRKTKLNFGKMKQTGTKSFEKYFHRRRDNIFKGTMCDQFKMNQIYTNQFTVI